jgi:transcription termination/antitermination protein NusG
MEFHKIEGVCWTPVRTKPRQEKKLAEYCRANSVIYYLPLIKSVKRYNKRSVEHQVPMFPGYVFCAVDEAGYCALLSSGTIVYRIKVNDITEKTLIRDLIALQDFEILASMKDVVVRPEIVSGVQIAVVKGPFMGVNGIVEKRKDKTMITVNIDILGQSVSTAIDIGDVELEK